MAELLDRDLRESRKPRSVTTKAEWLSYSTTNPFLRARCRGQKRLLDGTSTVGSEARSPHSWLV
jgi:hypothetical protein